MAIPQAILEGADPAVVGRAAHKIEDYVHLGGLRYGVKTPRRPDSRFDCHWREATWREVKLILTRRDSYGSL